MPIAGLLYLPAVGSLRRAIEIEFLPLRCDGLLCFSLIGIDSVSSMDSHEKSNPDSQVQQQIDSYKRAIEATNKQYANALEVLKKIRESKIDPRDKSNA
jgi:hypothetical protein